MALLVGTSGPDVLQGLQASDVISGLDDLDILRGGGGGDALSGGLNVDRLEGEGGDDLLFTEGSEFVAGGPGIDVAILVDNEDLEEVFTFTPNAVFGIEGIQDVPDADTTVTVAASLLNTVEGDTFLVALGDGNDELRVINDISGGLEVTPSGQILVGGKTVGLEGVESLAVEGTDGLVTDSFTASQLLGVGNLGDFAFVGPGSAAAEAAELVELSDNPAVSEGADIIPVADSLLALVSEDQLQSPGVTDDVLTGSTEGDLLFY